MELESLSSQNAQNNSSPYSLRRLKGVTHIGRHLQIGVTYSSTEERTIACRISLTDVLLDLLDLVLMYLSTRSPPCTDVPSE